jgi:malate dehydrogenase
MKLTEMPKITVVGAGNVGAQTAQLLLLKNLADVVLIDIAPGLPQGKALDIMHMRSIENFDATILGTNDYKDTADSDIVIVTAGLPRKPGMTREDLQNTNAEIVTAIFEECLKYSPEAIYISVTNPMDVMIALVHEKFDISRERLIGMGGVLDTARYIYAISVETGADVKDIDAMVIGAHGQAMLPLISTSTVGGKPLKHALSEEQLERIVKRTIDGGAEVVELLKTGSAYFAPGASIVKMVEAILTESGEVLSVCALLQGEYGIEGTYMCVPCRLNRGGLSKIVEFKLTACEQTALSACALSIKSQVNALVDRRS